MHESLGMPACFTGVEPPPALTGLARSGQSVVASVYRTKVAGESRLVTVTWCKSMLLHGLSVTIQGSEDYGLRVELKPWYFWRKTGSKNLVIEGRDIGVFWDLKAAVFEGETDPRSGYYVAIVCGEEVVLLVGDMKKDAYRRTKCRPALVEPVLVSRTEHLFGKRRFPTGVWFGKKGRLHQVLIECKSNGFSADDEDQDMEITIDGFRVLQVKHLKWKFRGNERVKLSRERLELEVYWDVHDWFFGSGPRHGLFIFTPVPEAGAEEPPSPPMVQSEEDVNGCRNRGEHWLARGGKPSGFCLFVYAWRID